MQANSFLQAFRAPSGRSGVRLAGRSPTLWLLAAGIALISGGLRLLEWPLWTASRAFVDGHAVLPTADAYAWLAGAVGSGRMVDWPMSRLVGLLAQTGGVDPADVAFWLPLALAWLPGPVILLLCWQRGRTLAGFLGGIFAVASLGYLARTRLGYADTDLFAVFLAAGLAAFWVAVLESLDASRGTSDERALASMPLALGVIGFAAGGHWLYPSGYPLVVAISLMAALLSVVLPGIRGSSGIVLATASCAFLAVHFGLPGAATGMVIGVLILRRGEVGPGLGVSSVLLAAAAILVLDQPFLQETTARVAAYLGTGPLAEPISNWALPSINESIQETDTVGRAEYFQRTGTHWILLMAGLAGYGVAAGRWPALLAFLPLLGLGLASFYIGHRFAMYAAPVLGLGLGLGTALALERFVARPALRAVAQLGLAAGIVVLVGWHARAVEVRPAVDPQWARAVTKLQRIDADRGRIWAWWDEGYAAQFYARLPTLADGGNASRLRTFALGQVFGARDLGQAAAFMRRAAGDRGSAIGDSEDWRRASYDSVPLERLIHLEAEAAQRVLDQLPAAAGGPSGERPDEFVVASWPLLRKAQWADLYGRWRLNDGGSGYGRILTLRPPVRLDESRGTIETPEGTVALRSIHILESGDTYVRRWSRPAGAHAIVNNEVGEGVLVDSNLFEVLAVQLLVADPAVLDRHFELIVDAAPAVRIFRLRANPQPGGG